MAVGNDPKWHFSAFYGAPAAHNRHLTWTLLQRLKDVAPLTPWLVIGDFNEILSNHNKSGGSLRNETQMDRFRSTLDICQLFEQPFTGDPFTWIKGRHTVDTIKESLIVQVMTLAALPKQQKSHRFRFEKLWLKEEEAATIIKDQWKPSPAGNVLVEFNHCLQKCSDSLQEWHQRKFGNIKKKIKNQQQQVASLNNQQTRTTTAINELKQSEAILDELLAQEETYWQQRSRVDWMKCGDQNTKFFHAYASSRNQHNKISKLNDANGVEVTKKEGLTDVISSYFAALFKASPVDPQALQTTLNTIPTTVTAEMNNSLTQPYTSQEVITALRLMSPDKSPGSDGMSAMFYQQYWDIVGNDVTKVVLAVLNEGYSMDSINRSLITLIPKIKLPSDMNAFRPISLCNVIYKLISKVLANRFKEVLPSVISENQSAFFANRLITDNILVAFELIHHLKHKTHGSKGFSALKLDMSKAFDRVEWVYICEVMRKMGFHTTWIETIHNCLNSTSFSFMLNGEAVGNVQPTRGLRQGDPLSPYLFLICSEGLSRLLQYEESLGNLKGLRLTRHSPSISHLLFADDSLLFCEATQSSASALKRILDIYHRASDQLLNNNKSVMSFSPNTTQAAKDLFHHILGMPIAECHERYLGLPAYASRDKKEMFSDVKERIWQKLHAWNEKLFSVGGKEVLLKAVVQSIPTYAMSCFRLPITFCNQLESMVANFWWGANKDGSKIHWKRWKLLCKSKFEGGMGFCSFVHFNQALLAKQAWRIFEYPNSLLSRLLKHRYFSNNSFLEARLGHSPSLTWQGIHWGRELLIEGLRFKIGNGHNVQARIDKWIPGHYSFQPISFNGPSSLTVAALITESREWNINLLHQYFQPIDIDKILSIPLSFFPTPDRLIWHHTTTRIYTVNSGFHLACNIEESMNTSASNSHSAWWKSFWQLNLPPKIKIFAWKVMQNALPVAATLHKRKVIDSASCSMCTTAWESIGHALFTCHSARSVWKKSRFSIDFHNARNMYNGDYLIHLSNQYSKPDFELLICIMWAIWGERNKVLHGGQKREGLHTFIFANNYLDKYKQATDAPNQSSLPLSSSNGHVQQTTQTPEPAQQPFGAQWRPPDPLGLKLNVDAALHSDKKILGVGAVVRNHQGQVIAAFSKPVQGCFRSDEMEAKALFHSINWVMQQQLPITHIETDALRVSMALNSSSIDLSCFSDLIMDVRYLLSSFSGVIVSHVKRNANHAAHGLAKYALELDEDVCWTGVIPSPIFSVIIDDYNQ
uniref:Reverse transcriptase domain-containing protein n=1 Tax=Cannabis sativa TaxID=3483 RepID=A0A803NGJ4_CANSA